ncbi:ATP synthase F0 subcomplex B subunit [Balneicella halophila]|uniref:ATP synthase subunit b n=1 Tax=Balneicella halophila TaxID=1537566 RepID=A0A7L4UP67_BALHA|nr:F0F1 ATP synthase subunit B [Balneicella halophila]PVX50915.1 ATP synthase F0 subcomplex B subunit [Balneicella halophila]
MNPLVNPGIGLIFWFSIAIIILIVLLKKFAWKPILKAIHQRNNAIDKAMSAAVDARAEVDKMKAKNEQIIQQAKLEKEAILKEAKLTSEKIVAASKDKATEEANRILAEAQKRITQERLAAVQDMKSQVAEHAVDIAEKILKDSMQKPAVQDQYLSSLMNDIELN